MQLWHCKIKSRSKNWIQSICWSSPHFFFSFSQLLLQLLNKWQFSSRNKCCSNAHYSLNWVFNLPIRKKTKVYFIWTILPIYILPEFCIPKDLWCNYQTKQQNQERLLHEQQMKLLKEQLVESKSIEQTPSGSGMSHPGDFKSSLNVNPPH